jgi:hypothetical protein
MQLMHGLVSSIFLKAQVIGGTSTIHGHFDRYSLSKESREVVIFSFNWRGFQANIILVQEEHQSLDVKTSGRNNKGNISQSNDTNI